MLAEWEEKLDGWKFGKFATMDVNEIEAVAGQFAKRVYKLGKDPAVRGWKVVESLKERVDNLKKLGNMCLKPFGLSTNNFKMEQNESGSYNIQFQQNP